MRRVLKATWKWDSQSVELRGHLVRWSLVEDDHEALEAYLPGGSPRADGTTLRILRRQETSDFLQFGPPAWCVPSQVLEELRKALSAAGDVQQRADLRSRKTCKRCRELSGSTNLTTATSHLLFAAHGGFGRCAPQLDTTAGGFFLLRCRRCRCIWVAESWCMRDVLVHQTQAWIYPLTPDRAGKLLATTEPVRPEIRDYLAIVAGTSELQRQKKI